MLTGAVQVITIASSGSNQPSIVFCFLLLSLIMKLFWGKGKSLNLLLLQKKKRVKCCVTVVHSPSWLPLCSPLIDFGVISPVWFVSTVTRNEILSSFWIFFENLILCFKLFYLTNWSDDVVCYNKTSSFCLCGLSLESSSCFLVLSVLVYWSISFWSSSSWYKKNFILIPLYPN